MSAAKKKAETLRRTAYHEAGHAVAAYVLRRRFTNLSIVEDEYTLGRVSFAKHHPKFQPDVMSFDESRSQIERDVMISAAGDAAEFLLSGRHDWRGAHQDTQNAHDMASYLCGDPEEETAYVRWLWIRTQNLLRQPIHWRAIEVLAAALLEQERIGQKEARVIIRDAVSSYEEPENAPLLAVGMSPSLS